MATDDAAQNVATDASPESEERERSTIVFTYNDLDDAVQIARGVHQVGGSTAQWDQLAAQLNLKSSTSGSFRLKTLAAKNFGLVTYTSTSLQLTELGLRVCDPRQEKAARAEAFLAVPLYRAVYDQFKGATLPPPAALEDWMVSVGVAKKQKDKARQSFQRSAQQAGFFWHGQDRLVMPPSTPGAASGEASGSDNSQKDKDRGNGNAGSFKGGGGDDSGGHHPFIQGLLKTLPPANTEWTREERKKWLCAAATIFELIYTDKGSTSGVLKIEIEDSSAK